MKLIIDIPEEIIKLCKDDKVSTVKLSAEYFRNGTPIPDNATNGDVIKAVFYNDILTNFTLSYNNIEWWHEPYQKGGKE